MALLRSPIKQRNRRFLNNPARRILIAFVGLFIVFTVASAQTNQTEVSTDSARGVQLFRQRKYPDAVAVLKKALKQNKADAEGWHYLGLALLRDPKQEKAAAKAFETAIKLRPNFAGSHVGLSYALLIRGKLDQAVRESRLGLQLDPSNATAHYIVGAVRLHLDDPAEALKEAREANRLNPEMGPAYLLKAQALLGVSSSAYSVRSVKPPTPTTEQREERRRMRMESAAMFKEAAESLNTYLKLTTDDPSTELWREQLQTISVYASYDPDSAKEEALFSVDDVTTKAVVRSKPEPRYTEAARHASVTGKVVLRAVFAADGTVRHILVLSGLPHGLTENAVNAAKKIKFSPAFKEGRAVSTFVQLEYHFNLY